MTLAFHAGMRHTRDFGFLMAGALGTLFTLENLTRLEGAIAGALTIVLLSRKLWRVIIKPKTKLPCPYCGTFHPDI